MSGAPYNTEPIDLPLTGSEQFDSGVASLDDWLRSTAVTMAKANLGRTFIWRDEAGLIVAYFHLTPHEVSQEGLPNRNIYGSRRDRPVPGYLIAKLALSKDLHGQGLGTRLLTQALEHAAIAAKHAGGRLVVVDAIDDGAADFYRKHDFKDVRSDKPGRPQRLFRPIKDVFADLAPILE